MNDPAAIRRRMRALRDALPLPVRQEAGEAVCRKLWDAWCSCRPQFVFAYAPLGSELDIQPFLQRLWDQGEAIALPRVLGPGEMEFFSVNGPADLCGGAYGIREPSPACEQVEPTRADWILIPALAFSLQGGRIGYGGGFYDRYLPRCQGHRILIAYDFQEAEFAPKAHDVPVDLVLTPSRDLFTQEV